ncbi:MAG TPA: PTS system mannose/fructose/sorbose family transporter subunit IID [Nitrospirota bacterium]|nr:PTS system mannose/fructose/sorbose family transporter subunit IID [Nitrospirota bacterium]
MNGEHNRVSIRDLMKVFGRALLLQASWSFDRMQTAGFAYALSPVLKKLYPDPQQYEARLRVHLEYFNTQPYFASFLIGAAVKLEQDRAEGRESEADPAGLKASLMAPLGALGDSFFWGSLKPMSAVAAAALLVTGSWWAPFLFLFLYNTWHVGLRLGMLLWGYAGGGNAVELMSRYPFTRMARRFKIISLALLGGIVGSMPMWRQEFKITTPLPDVAVAGAGLTVIVAAVAVMRKGGSPVKLMLGLAALCLALAYVGVVL